MELYIDTSDNKRLVVQLLKDGKVVSEMVETENPKADQVLILIENICKKEGITVQDLTNINVNRGPGSFTGLRVGVAIANTLAFSLGISVNNKKVGELETPSY